MFGQDDNEDLLFDQQCHDADDLNDQIRLRQYEQEIIDDDYLTELNNVNG